MRRRSRPIRRGARHEPERHQAQTQRVRKRHGRPFQ
ncbi:MAG: hypothetical protein N2689_11815 [Verrucomicrobiae bacterium]|nr:hypothetical protein [Verrucomicrobiae bacterium]